jgi:hypothetical protein
MLFKNQLLFNPGYVRLKKIFEKGEIIPFIRIPRVALALKVKPNHRLSIPAMPVDR